MGVASYLGHRTCRNLIFFGRFESQYNKFISIEANFKLSPEVTGLILFFMGPPPELPCGQYKQKNERVDIS